MADSDPGDVTEQQKIDAWREHELIRAGYPDEDAKHLAERPDVDLHQAADLLANGCDVTTAMEILL